VAEPVDDQRCHTAPIRSRAKPLPVWRRVLALGEDLAPDPLRGAQIAEVSVPPHLAYRFAHQLFGVEVGIQQLIRQGGRVPLRARWPESDSWDP
jgi:hypothetical protein